MPAEHLTTGFYGKIPATGDFVGRGLPGGFVRTWDRWVAANLAPLQSSGTWPDHLGLRFIIGPDANGPMAGIVMPSRDRAGRRFPLTVASPVSVPATGLASTASEWFAAVKEVADLARQGELTADEFGRALAELPFPDADAEGNTVLGIALWAEGTEPVEVAPDAPISALEPLLVSRGAA
ncbi:type VI secretion system-associated protein TagF [Aminobacter sp. HY435]|uniref:type VI secretion system-associated protein TagF n=1 Tax=Aminobacter sp. HY435 TaxID=2970917 RepID=UPI0022B99D75|nr:type VI secretion system-associated protein TagF [Aminobacter sp. HY435]